jgi:hypothetical protein
MTTEHKTRRGALLAQLEWRRDGPGVYQVEGRYVERRPGGMWWVEGAAAQGLCWFASFTDALEWIADLD